MITRRTFVNTALAAMPLAKAAFGQQKVSPGASRFGGVQIGVQTYSYRTLRDFTKPLDLAGQKELVNRIVAAMVQNQINSCEFWIAFIEPVGGTYSRAGTTPAMLAAREELKKWRLSHPMEIFEYSRKAIADAGIAINSAMFNFTDYIVDEEIDHAFEAAKALGTKTVSANCTVRSIRRAAPFADKHNLLLAAHSETAPFDSNIDGMVFANNLVDALRYSSNMRITLDTGHFTAYGQNALQFVKDHHDKIVNLHLKDRLKNHPEPHTDENTPEFGKGDAPIKEILQFMKKRKLAFPATIEYEYKSDRPAVEEVRRCVDYAKAALA
ncbi:MAG: TIM barrel protein [Bryobacteraceae bacterium]